MRHWGAPWCVALGACVTESLTICINCDGFSLGNMRGGFVVTLRTNAGSAPSCDDIRIRMDPPISWTGCLTPRGGTADSIRGIIRLSFEDSTGAVGALEFFDLQGTVDSVDGYWRSTCNKQNMPRGGCPLGEGTARWLRPVTAGTAVRGSALPPPP